MSRVPPRRAIDPAAASAACEPHGAITGMSVDDARRYLATHGLTLVVATRDGMDVPDADWRTPRGVLVTVRGSEVVQVNGRV
jgi:hypothetical protein